jgi:hypothetical protein
MEGLRKTTNDLSHDIRRLRRNSNEVLNVGLLESLMSESTYIAFRFPVGASDFSVLHGVKICFGAHSASSPMVRGLFTGSRAAGE